MRRLRDALGEVLLAPQGTYGSGAAPPAALVEATSGNPSEFTKETVSSAMAVLKQRDNVRALSQYLKSELPPLYTALIAERDEYMANSLLQSPGKRMVAVTGLAHMDGIERRFLSASAPRGCPAR